MRFSENEGGWRRVIPPVNDELARKILIEQIKRASSQAGDSQDGAAEPEGEGQPFKSPMVRHGGSAEAKNLAREILRRGPRGASGDASA